MQNNSHSRYSQAGYRRNNGGRSQTEQGFNKGRVSVSMSMYDYEYLEKRDRLASRYEELLLHGYHAESGTIKVTDELRSLLDDISKNAERRQSVRRRPVSTRGFDSISAACDRELAREQMSSVSPPQKKEPEATVITNTAPKISKRHWLR